MISLRYRPSQRAVFTTLMLVSAVSLLLPAEWTDKAKGVAQFLAPSQDLAYSLGHQASHSMAELGVGTDQHLPQHDELILQLASTQALCQDLREENATLRRLRRDNAIPPEVPLLPAKIVARDIAAWRDSVLIQRGSSRAVNRQDWVASRFLINRGRAVGIENGQAVLALESLLGRIEMVNPYMSRVQLLSDIDSNPIEVRVATFVETIDETGQITRSMTMADYPCSLHGLGKGKMGIADVPYRHVQAEGDSGSDSGTNPMRIGDLVFTAPGELGLPVPMVVGKITALEQNPKKRLVYNLIVEPAISVGEIRDVFVIPLLPLPVVPFHE